MTLTDEYAQYLTCFLEDARGQILHQVRQERFGALRSLSIFEDDHGLSAEVKVDLTGEVVKRWGSALYTRRALIVDRFNGPLDDVSNAAGLLAAAVTEDLHTCGREHLRPCRPDV